MQVSIKLLEKFLKELGVKDVVVDAEADDKDVSIDDLISQVDANRSAIIEPQIKDTVKSELEAGIKGRIFGTVKAAFNKAGIKLTEEYNTVDEMVKKALDGYNDKFSQDAQKLRDDMQAMITEHESALQTEKDRYEKELSQERERFVDRDIEEILQGYIKDIPRVGGDEITQAKQVKQFLKDQYHLAYSPEERKISIMNKEKPEHPVYNEQKTKLKEVGDVVREWADKIGITAKDTRHNNPGAAMNGGGGKGAMIEENAPRSTNPVEMNDAAIKNLLGN